MYTILLVDDDVQFRQELTQALPEYRWIEAGDGIEALAMLDKPHNIDLVLLDIYLPQGEKGTALLSKIKSVDASLGVIILTGYSSKDIAIQALKSHADDYVEKPFKIPHLQKVLTNYLEKNKENFDLNASSTADKIARIKRFLEQNIYKKCTLYDAAAQIYMEPKYVSRLFKEHAQQTFHEYKLDLKITQAKKLLVTTGLTVNELAYKLGYLNAESFIRIFKKTEKMTPAQYRSYVKKSVD